MYENKSNKKVSIKSSMHFFAKIQKYVTRAPEIIKNRSQYNCGFYLPGVYKKGGIVSFLYYADEVNNFHKIF